MKCPTLYNGASVRQIMFADICDVKSRQPLQKKDVVDDDFFPASVFKCLHSREPKMNVMEYITRRSHCYSYGPIHASFAAKRCLRMFL